MATSHKKSSGIAKNLNLKRADYPPDIVKFVMGLRAASYKAGGTDLRYLFRSLDIDNSGDLNLNEFKLALRRFVCHACHCVCRVDLEGVTFMLCWSASYCLNLLSQFSCTHARRWHQRHFARLYCTCTVVLKFQKKSFQMQGFLRYSRWLTKIKAGELNCLNFLNGAAVHVSHKINDRAQ